jgi:elongation factor P
MLGHTDLKTGVLVEIDNVPYRVTDYSHAAMGRGGAVVRCKLKNLLTGNVIEKTFRTADKIEQAHIDRKNMQYLYAEGDTLHFMDQVSYDQEAVTREILGDQAKYLLEGNVAQILSFNGRVIGMEMPNSAFFKVTYTEPGAKGDTATNALKPATIENGMEIMVPLFINVDDEVKVDTRSGQYLERKK